MFWFQKNRPDTVYMDIRKVEETLCDGRKLIIEPDIIGDFRDIPFPDDTFYLVVFDPPHLKYAGETSWLAKSTVCCQIIGKRTSGKALLSA